jgi:hypothetical protein
MPRTRLLALAVPLCLMGCKRDESSAPAPPPAQTSSPSPAVPRSAEPNAPPRVASAGPAPGKGVVPAKVKLVPLDLTPYGIRATIDVPEGAKAVADETSGVAAWVEIKYGGWYELNINDLPYDRKFVGEEYRKGSNFVPKAVSFPVDEPDTLMAEVGKDEFRVHRWVTIAGEPVELRQWGYLPGRPAADLVLASARSLRETPAQKEANDREAAARAAFQKAGGKLLRTMAGKRLEAWLVGDEVDDTAVGPLAALPVEGVFIENAPKVSAGGVKQLSGLPRLKRLHLTGLAVTDAMLAEAGRLKTLEAVRLKGTSATDQGFKALAALRGLRMLWVWGGDVDVSAPALDAIAGMTAMEELYLNGLPVADATLKHVGGMTGLRKLSLAGTKVTDAGLAHLAPRTGLKLLNLEDTAVTDAGLSHLKGLKSLEELNLAGTKITDRGMPHLHGLTGLRTLYVSGTAVTKKAVEDLWKVNPEVKVSADE